MSDPDELDRMAARADEMAREVHQENHFGRNGWSRARFDREKSLEEQARKLREEADRARRARTSCGDIDLSSMVRKVSENGDFFFSCQNQKEA